MCESSSINVAFLRRGSFFGLYITKISPVGNWSVPASQHSPCTDRTDSIKSPDILRNVAILSIRTPILWERWIGSSRSNAPIPALVLRMRACDSIQRAKLLPLPTFVICSLKSRCDPISSLLADWCGLFFCFSVPTSTSIPSPFSPRCLDGRRGDTPRRCPIDRRGPSPRLWGLFCPLLLQFPVF
jgi:hypothetical protein